MRLSVLLLICSCFFSATSDFVDHYATLGVSRDAQLGEIRLAYKGLVKVYHPDKKKADDHVGAKYESDQFIAIQEAYEVLKDPERRALYNSHYPNAGLPWWSSLRSCWDGLTIPRRLSSLHYSIIQAFHDVYFRYQILTFQFIRYIINEVPVFISKLKSACDKWTQSSSIGRTGFTYGGEVYSRLHQRNHWWLPEYNSFKGSLPDLFMVLGLSSVCLMSKYLSRLKLFQAVSFPFFFNMVMFPIWLTICLPLLVIKKLPYIFGLALILFEVAVYRLFARKILSDILQNIDEGVKTHENEVFYYIFVATVISFPVFNKYKNQIQLFARMCICTVIHIATCVAVFRIMIFKEAVAFFMCLTMLIILIDKFPVIITILMYLLVQIISGYCLDTSPMLFILTISLVFMILPISCGYEGARKSSLYYLHLLWWQLKWRRKFQTMDRYDIVGKETTHRALQDLRIYCREDRNGTIPDHLRDNTRFQQFLAGADHVGQTEQDEQIQENGVTALQQEISFYVMLTICCFFVMFIYEFY